MANKAVSIPAEAAGTVLLDYLRKIGAAPAAPCGGRGTCGQCRVRVLTGEFLSAQDRKTPVSPDEDGCVRACQALCPATGATVCLPENRGSGLTAFAATETKKENKPGAAGLGVALDIGTTTLAAALVDRAASAVLATVSGLNPQQSYGADVITRIGACRDGHLAAMHTAVLDGVRELIARLPIPAGESPALTVAGNPTMLHLFAGIDPGSMGAYPFTPAYTGTYRTTGAALGLPVGEVTLLPSASAFIGSDITGGVFVTGMTGYENPTLLVDMGTNGEMVLCTGRADGAKLITASTAAGPALEGANISCGMGGIDGAVSRVTVTQDGLAFRTVGDQPPRGICGCGLVDLTACLLERGILDETGYMDEPYRLSGVWEKDAGAEPAAETPVVLTGQDVRELQLAKSALRAGLEALLDRAGVAASAVERVFLAGGLGYYIDPDAAVRIGLLPDDLRRAVKPVGNTALAGAVRVLTDPDALDAIAAVADGCETFELNRSAVFEEQFMEQMLFPE